LHQGQSADLTGFDRSIGLSLGSQHDPKILF